MQRQVVARCRRRNNAVCEAWFLTQPWSGRNCLIGGVEVILETAEGSDRIVKKGELSVTAYLLSQEKIIRDCPDLIAIF